MVEGSTDGSVGACQWHGGWSVVTFLVTCAGFDLEMQVIELCPIQDLDS